MTYMTYIGFSLQQAQLYLKRRSSSLTVATTLRRATGEMAPRRVPVRESACPRESRAMRASAGRGRNSEPVLRGVVLLRLADQILGDAALQTGDPLGGGGPMASPQGKGALSAAQGLATASTEISGLFSLVLPPCPKARRRLSSSACGSVQRRSWQRSRQAESRHTHAVRCPRPSTDVTAAKLRILLCYGKSNATAQQLQLFSAWRVRTESSRRRARAGGRPGAMK